MVLGIDIGNTHIVLGVFSEGKLLVDWRIATDREKTADEYGIQIRILFDYAGIDYSAVKGVVISSVVPPLTPVMERMAVKYFRQQPLIVGPGIKTCMPIKYENPREVGADRIVNAVAAYDLYGGPLIIVDFGTATTFCAVSEKGEYLGGAIAPGIGISAEALMARAAKLPRVELVKPKSVIGRNTIMSMQAGIIYGYVGLVEYIVTRMKEEMGGTAKVVATGGWAELIARETNCIQEVHPHLTLYGLWLLYQRNRGNE
ncbi:MAG: type pantothenate kinase [Eubacteriales bacterium]|nr:type pantothenate kinase [Eubacteriales bacterium]